MFYSIRLHNLKLTHEITTFILIAMHFPSNGWKHCAAVGATICGRGTLSYALSWHHLDIGIYAVARGGDGDSVGMYASYEDALGEVHGSGGAVWQRVATIEEGGDFIQEHLPHSPAHVRKRYVVAQGQTSNGVGVYDSWAAVAPEVVSILEACFKAVM